MNKYWLGVVVIILFCACGNDDETSKDVDVEIAQWLDSVGISASRDDDSGIYYYSITENASGNAISSGNVVGIYYTLSDLDGNVIASHQRSNGDSLILKQGVSAVYPVGLDVGLSFIRQGATYGLIIPPSLGYNQLTSGAIDPNAITLMEVEVVSVNNESEIYSQELIDIEGYVQDQNLNDLATNPVDAVEYFASGVAYKRTSEGAGSLPLNGDSIVLDYTGRFLENGNTFDSGSSFAFTYGSENPRALVTGFEFGVSLMQVGEQALIFVPSSQGYRESALVIPPFIINDLIEDSIIPDYVSTIPPYSTLFFDITRVN